MHRMAKPMVTRFLAAFLIAGIALGGAPSPALLAQDEEAATTPAPVILPVDNANFLPGARFDIRIETYGEAVPADFAATINGEELSTFLGVEGTAESWQISDDAGSVEELAEVDPATIVTVNALTWRNVSLPAAGDYEVVVTADGTQTSATWVAREPAESAGARNIILFVADGGSQAVYTATRLVSRGMVAGVYGENLSFENFDEIGFLHTGGLDSIITDSANSISTYNTGHKTVLNANGVYPDSSYDVLDDPRVEKFAYLASRLQSKSIGIVTTANWADATPNGVAGYGRDRSETALNAYVTQPLDEGLLPAVILGGGARNMQPSTAEGSRRTDERDVFADYEANGYQIVTTATELAAAAAGEQLPERLMGIFHPNNMDVWLDRNVYTDNVAALPDQPGLEQMTMAALNVLNQNENGFYALVEAASVDKQLHPMDYDRALADAIEFDRTIAATIEWVAANAPDTLIIVTSDHAHSYDVYGTVDVEAFNAAVSDIDRRGAINIYADAGFPTYEDADGDSFPDNWAPSVVLAQGKVDNPLFTEDFQVSATPRVPALNASVAGGALTVTVDNPEDDPTGLSLGGNLPDGANSSVHTLQSVPVFAQGPGAECLGRVMENTEVFFCMAAAFGLNPAAAAE